MQVFLECFGCLELGSAASISTVPDLSRPMVVRFMLKPVLLPTKQLVVASAPFKRANIWLKIQVEMGNPVIKGHLAAVEVQGDLERAVLACKWKILFVADVGRG